MKQRFTTFLAALFFSLSMALPASATVSDTGYSDVDAGAWYAESVAWCRENNLMAGVGGGRFAPDSTLTRAMLAAVLQRLSDTQPGTSPSEGEETMLHITVNGTTLTATLANNSSAEAFRELLASGPRTIQMSDYYFTKIENRSSGEVRNVVKYSRVMRNEPQIHCNING